MKITPDMYAWCRDRVKHWQTRLALGNYVITVRFKKITNIGETIGDSEAMQATLTMNTNYEFENQSDIERAIFHEAMEIRMWRITELLRENISCERTAREVHRVINTFENIFF
jgi:hypothetical protein